MLQEEQSKEFTEKAKELSDLLEGILFWVSKDRKKKDWLNHSSAADGMNLET